MNSISIVLVALYHYVNFSIRIMHPLLESVAGVKAHTIFFKSGKENSLSYPTPKEEALFIELIVKLKPKIVGFSVLSPYAPVASRLTKLIKKHSPSTLVIWGGIHPTISPESCIEEADIICVGEGEGAITELVECLRDEKPYQHIRNLWVKNGNHIIKNSMRPLIEDLDSLPFASYGNNSYYFIDANEIERRDSVLFSNVYMIQTSRGCPYVCAYCANSFLQSLFKGLGPYVRMRSVGNVIREIKENNKSERIVFVDDMFASDISWLDEFEIQYKSEIGLPFCAAYNPKSINTAMLNKLSNAGLCLINIGIQSGSDYIRNQVFHRPGKNSELIKAVNEIDSRKIKIKYDLIVNNPYETEQSLRDTIDFLLQLPRPLRFDLFALQYFPNYPFTKKAIEDKIILPERASVNSLIESATKNFLFVPKLLPYANKQIFQNLIWLIVNNHSKNNIVKYAVFGNASGSNLCLIYLNLKAVFLGKIFGQGSIIMRIQWRAYLRRGFTYMAKGDFKTLYIKIRQNISRLIQNSAFSSRNAGIS